MRQQGFRSDQIVEDHLIRSGSKKVEKPEPLDSNNSGIKPRWPVSQNIMRKHTEIYVFKLFPMRAESALWSDLLASLATTTASIVFRLGWKEKSCYCICIPLKHKLKSTKLFKFCSKFLNKTKKPHRNSSMQLYFLDPSSCGNPCGLTSDLLRSHVSPELNVPHKDHFFCWCLLITILQQLGVTLPPIADAANRNTALIKVYRSENRSAAS